MAKRVCPVPGCPTLTPGGKCPTHRRADRQARGTTTAQGYGWKHQQRRAQLLAELTPGTPCPRCGWPMMPTEPLDAGHTTAIALDPDAVADRLECSRCNRSEGGKLGARLRRNH